MLKFVILREICAFEYTLILLLFFFVFLHCAACSVICCLFTILPLLFVVLFIFIYILWCMLLLYYAFLVMCFLVCASSCIDAVALLLLCWYCCFWCYCVDTIIKFMLLHWCHCLYTLLWCFVFDLLFACFEIVAVFLISMHFFWYVFFALYIWFVCLMSCHYSHYANDVLFLVVCILFHIPFSMLCAFLPTPISHLRSFIFMLNLTLSLYAGALLSSCLLYSYLSYVIDIFPTPISYTMSCCFSFCCCHILLNADISFILSFVSVLIVQLCLLICLALLLCFCFKPCLFASVLLYFCFFVGFMPNLCVSMLVF